MKKKKTEKLLTEAELELMTILWKLGEGSVADVLAGLPAERKLAYTSVSTILRILEQKEIIESRKAGRGHIYVPRVDKQSYEAAALSHVVTKVFDGEPTQLVRRLLEAGELDEAELQSIRKLVAEKLS